MKNIIKKFIIILLILAIPVVSFTGCKDATEIERLGIILAVGFDLTSDNNYLVTIEVMDSNSVSDNVKSNSYTAEGETVFKAITNLYKRLGEQFNYAHIQYIVIGDSMARKGIAPIMDFSLRYNQIRPTIPFLVTNGEAQDIISAKISTYTTAALSVTNLLELQRKRGETAVTTNLDFVNSVAHGSRSTTCGLINIDNSKLDKNKNYNLSGAAVFHKDKLVGYLSTRETVGLNWIRGSIDKNILMAEYMIQYPENYKVSLDVTSASEKTDIKLHNNNVNIKVNIKAKSSIREMTGNVDPNKNPNIMDELAQEQNKVIFNDVYLVINKAQKDFKLDIFDFGNIMMRKYPNEWTYMEKNWNDIFENLKVDINVNTQVNKTGVLSKPPL
ncbi:Ger(x)C family spore germination protein [Clostridium pasteurianum]|uniref:Germination protein, Ger(X)C family n=1 Tax=Clostridium pasteurianum BC1 TaxID=86416 RepID=R4K059_CLOPA|nr:Ger(x)C family spore germination protein [Clostridium pasteurianum]AGK95166.1 germination protein, Ger(X)C family [Clostridium pasteurianum BC1]